MFKIIFVAILTSIILCSSIEADQNILLYNTLKKDEVLICIRWKWSNTPQEGKVNCVEWAKKDCSNRLYPEICKKGG
jgi:hypothetical protein